MKKILLIITVIISIFVAYGYFFWRYIVNDFKFVELQLKDTNKTIFLKNLRRGLNYSEVSISASKRRATKAKEDYVYTWDETLFYRIKNDTLFILCRNKASEPSNFSSGVIVTQEEYSNLKYYELIGNFKKLGFEKFPK